MLQPQVTERDNIYGLNDAKITLVEYGDYECPHCGSAYPIIKKIQENMGDEIRFVFRNFPLIEMHPNAMLAAIATEAAAKQNAFWQMHDIIFENQKSLSYDDILDYAEEIALDLEILVADMEDDSLKQKVEADFESGIISGVNGTPTFFITGIRHNGSWEEKELMEVLNKIIHF